MSAIKNTISISLFNKGLAGKIFNEVKASGPKVVMKNNAAECILMSPEQYIQLMDEVEDARLLKIAVERLEEFDDSELISADVLYQKIGISQSDIEDCRKEDGESENYDLEGALSSEGWEGVGKAFQGSADFGDQGNQ